MFQVSKVKRAPSGSNLNYSCSNPSIFYFPATMTSILSPGKYRSRKDLSTGSIPTLVSLEEESSLTTVTSSVNGNGHHHHHQVPFANTLNIKNGLNTAASAITAAKSPRRSSLGIGLLGGRSHGHSAANAANDKSNKRRSSIAVAFLGGGRRDSRSSAHNLQYPIATIPEKYHKTTESDVENDSPAHYYTVPSGSTVATVMGGAAEDATGISGSEYSSGSLPAALNGGATSPNGYDKKRRRSSSWQTKLERRRRKGMTSAATLDDGGGGGVDLDGFGSTGNGLDAFGASKYGREKRHSWWNIFVPENLKQR